MRVRDVMTRDVVSVRPDMPFRDLAALLHDRRISGVPVTADDGRVLGVVSESDVVRQLGRPMGHRRALDWILGVAPSAADRRRMSAATVRDSMTSPAVVIAADRPLREAAAVMVERDVNRLPVVEHGRLAGIVSRADLVGAYLRRDDDILHAIRDDVLRRTMWLEPDDLRVSVRDGVVRLGGQVDRRSTARIVEKLVGLVDGVVGVESRLTWQDDDRRFTSPAREPEPTAASLVARDHPRSLSR